MYWGKKAEFKIKLKYEIFAIQFFLFFLKHVVIFFGNPKTIKYFKSEDRNFLEIYTQDNEFRREQGLKLLRYSKSFQFFIYYFKLTAEKIKFLSIIWRKGLYSFFFYPHDFYFRKYITFRQFFFYKPLKKNFFCFRMSLQYHREYVFIERFFLQISFFPKFFFKLYFFFMWSLNFKYIDLYFLKNIENFFIIFFLFFKFINMVIFYFFVFESFFFLDFLTQEFTFLNYIIFEDFFNVRKNKMPARERWSVLLPGISQFLNELEENYFPEHPYAVRKAFVKDTTLSYKNASYRSNYVLLNLYNGQDIIMSNLCFIPMSAWQNCFNNKLIRHFFHTSYPPFTPFLDEGLSLNNFVSLWDFVFAFSSLYHPIETFPLNTSLEVETRSQVFFLSCFLKIFFFNFFFYFFSLYVSVKNKKNLITFYCVSLVFLLNKKFLWIILFFLFSSLFIIKSLLLLAGLSKTFLSFGYDSTFFFIKLKKIYQPYTFKQFKKHKNLFLFSDLVWDAKKSTTKLFSFKKSVCFFFYNNKEDDENEVETDFEDFIISESHIYKFARLIKHKPPKIILDDFFKRKRRRRVRRVFKRNRYRRKRVRWQFRKKKEKRNLVKKKC